jgi:hypothetical protein
MKFMFNILILVSIIFIIPNIIKNISISNFDTLILVSLIFSIPNRIKNIKICLIKYITMIIYLYSGWWFFGHYN